MNLVALLKQPIALLFSMVFLASLTAIIFERALNVLWLDYMDGWAILGIAFLLLATIPVIVHKKPVSPPFWFIAGVGMILIIYSTYTSGGLI